MPLRPKFAFLSAACACLGAVSAPAAAPEVPSFELDIMPILTARGCNAGACHGKQRGQNGFQLSLLGFDPDFDYFALTREGRGRRVFPGDPERSLLLRKGSAQMPHGGGVRIKAGERDYLTLRRWIAGGMPRRNPGEPKVVRIDVAPTTRSVKPRQAYPLKVLAHYSDGSRRDVTPWTTF